MNEGFKGFPNLAGIGSIVLLYDSDVLTTPTPTIDTGANVIPGGFRMIEVFLHMRTDEAIDASGVGLRFNTDLGSNYNRQYSGHTNGTVSAAAETAQTSIQIVAPGSNPTSGVFGAWTARIFSYDNTQTFKTAITT